jgi:hypothetical protein
MITNSQLNCATLIHGTGLAKHLAGLLALMVDFIEYHIRNLANFIQRLQITTVRDADILISFSIVPFFTRVSCDETITIIRSI